MPLPNGVAFAGFTIVRLLGSGGRGEVYLAKHPRLPRRDALKILPTEVSADAEFRARFNREADLASTLFHPHIVGVHDRGEFDGRLWISMDFVDGQDTSRVLREHRPSGMPPSEVSRIVTAVAEALDYAHQRGMLHRDVKPANVLMTDPESDTERILLADFGIARHLDEVSGLTATNMTVGTVHYAAPEQLMDTDVDGRADQYGLAATAFHLLTGSPPFAHSNPAVVISRHIGSVPPALARTHPELAALDPVITRGMAKDPDARYGTCLDFAAALTAAVAGAPPTARIPMSMPRTPSASAEMSVRLGPAPVLQAPSTLAATPRVTTADQVGAPPPAKAPTLAAGVETPTARAAAVEPPTRHADREIPNRLDSRPVRLGAMLISLAALVVAVLITVVVVHGSHANRSSSAVPANTANAAPSSSNVPLASQLPAATLGCDVTTWPVRDKLAQLLVVGVTGADDARAVVANHHVGGIMIGSWTDLSMLTDGSLPAIASSGGPLPLAVSVDEEGGRVSRLKTLIGPQPSPRVLAATHTPDEVYAIALDRGHKMRGLGITIDFAPVADVTTEPDDEVIGDRSFGSDPEKVTEYAGAYARGLRDAGILPVLKHFPGHGHGSGDSHTGSVTTPPLDDLKNDDLVPYRTLTTAAPVAVMVGHLEVPGLTGTDPASLSPAAYQLLRSGGYGGPPFNGLAFTDALDAPAVSGERGVADATLSALRVGADVAVSLTTDEVPAVLDRLEQAVAAGELNIAAVDESLQRVVAVKGPPHC